MYFHTFGCKVNQYETQLLREQICSDGNYQPVNNIALADIAIINSCTVTHNADADTRQIVRRIIRVNPKCRIIVTGCYAVRSKEDILKISSLVEVYPEKEKIPCHLGLNNENQQTITYFAGHSRAFVKIQDGCDAFCSYCIVPYVRPKLWSKPLNAVLEEVNCLVENGYKEIVLCGIRLGKYNSNDTKNLPELVEKLLKLRNDFKISFSSLEVQEITDDLINIVASTNRIVRHFHIPLQSGDNEILRKMNRPYTAEEFQQKVDYIRRKLENVSLSTDVMVGFPGETEKHFINTYDFIKKNKFEKLHVFRFSPRIGTKAENFVPCINPDEIKKRAKLLLKFNRC
ncbi:MAG: tRNA (N(6)-L-threonylcarbamoyladenosine(37)-C(2))-methylthiotransferase MtaB [Endomicrobiia bacterium]